MISDSGCPYTLIPASSFSADELAEIYNQTRVDYIVPMPMNAKRMQSYVRQYDVNLDASYVICNQAEQVAGLGMLGVRDDRAWITRLGIIPERRGGGMGQCLMNALIGAAQDRCVRLVQLEVIEGNEPAHRLFIRCGFRESRRLLVIRRPPGKPALESPVPGAIVTPLRPDELWACLAQRGPGASWLNENTTLVKVEPLEGLRVKLPSGYTGWVIYQRTTFEITHVIFYAPPSVRDQMMAALLFHLHDAHPMQDTKIENYPLVEMNWPLFERMNYVEMFRRIEMLLQL